ncbi:hypothetical protein [Thalassoglobus neptunius]|nr:hypothetical protein [Thalassoglobus neptunius]
MRGWQLHYETISKLQEDLLALRKRFPTHGLCLGGDLNQSRDGYVWPWGRQWYGTRQGRELLTTCLSQADMICVTEQDFTSTGKLKNKSTIDHLCLTRSWASRLLHVDVWEAELLGAEPISDHNGVYLNLG